jgi:predicted O-methyltransferase YrrM
VLYHLGGRATRFRSAVAINDDVGAGSSHADFVVYADGRQAAAAHEVVAGEPARELVADVTGTHLLELVVTTSRWPHCHAVWVDPEVDELSPADGAGTLDDPLRMAEVALPPALPAAERCVATVASGGYESWLDDLLGSLVANGDVPDARLVVFLLGPSRACEAVAAKYRALPVRCRPLRRPNCGSKGVLYAVARVTAAEHYLCLDADMLVLGSLAPVFAALEACPPGRVLACREGNGHHYRDVEHVVAEAYGGQPGDIARITGGDGAEGGYTLVVNDGLFAGDRAAMLGLDGTIRGMPGAEAWIDAAPHVPWRNQAIFNLALARRGNGVELAESYNVQLHATDVVVEAGGGRRPRATWRGRPVRVLHASGSGRRRHPELHGRFSAVADPLVGSGDGDGYAAFLRALRSWAGLYGLTGLAWSFFGTQDGASARVRDPATMPILAFLHYVLRSSGCVRVVETGTARGVSTACLASAVVHRCGGRVVAFDTLVFEEREELWGLLPPAMRAAIDARTQDSLEGMRGLIAAGERFDAALLDSEHTEAQLWAELELAAQLVVPNGLILAHDSRWVPGVARALDRFEAVGYPVVRLWAAESGVREDSELGLAIAINARRETS